MHGTFQQKSSMAISQGFTDLENLDIFAGKESDKIP